MTLAYPSPERCFADALGILIAGFPAYGAGEFERAREAIRGAVADDMAQAIVSDSVLVLSQLGPDMLALDRSYWDEQPAGWMRSRLLAILEAFQAGDDERAQAAMRTMASSNPSGATISLRVLAKRLSLAGVWLTQASRSGLSGDPPAPARKARPALRLVWSNGRRAG